MKQFITTIVLFGIALSTTSDAAFAPEEPPPTDTDVRVLFIVDPVTVTGAQIIDRMDAVRQAWDSTQLNMSVPVGLTFANGGAPLIFFENLEGKSQEQAEIAVNLSLNALQDGGPSIRDEHKADIVIYVRETVPQLSIGESCGFVDRENWKTGTDDFQGIGVPPFDLDRRMFNSAYIAFVGTRKPSGDTCTKDVAAHEFGHLFGAGHTNLDQPSSGLFENSRANYQLKPNLNRPGFSGGFLS